MRARIDVQIESQARNVPSAAQFRAWARAALASSDGAPELTVRVVDQAESAELNLTYRKVSGPTNVLAFPFQAPEQVQMALLGDVVICAPLVETEARAQNKNVDAHWAHLVVHGTLHLLGYDHQKETDALRMESEERRILAGLGFPDPYLPST